MKYTVIKNIDQYREYAKLLHKLYILDPDDGTEENDELELLSLLITKYDEANFVFEKPNAIEAIEFAMEQQGLTKKDLVPILGTQSLVSDVLKGKRQLSKKMIKNIHEVLKIPYEILLDYEVK